MQVTLRNAVASLVAVLVATATGCASSHPNAAFTATSTTLDAAASPTTGPASTAPDTSCRAVSQPLRAGLATLNSGGVERQYSVALPSGFDPASATPLVLNFHGAGSNMTEQIAYSRLSTLGTARGDVVVTPEGMGVPNGWDLGGPRDITFTNDLLDTLGRQMCIDTHRVLAAGISNGSAFAEIVGCHGPYRFSVIAMVAATVPSTCPADRRVAAVAFAGTKDPVVPFGGGRVNAQVPGSAGAQSPAAPGAEGAIASLARHNGCDAEPTNTPIGADVIERAWSGCDDGAAVTFYRIEGGGHTWPGPIDLTKLGYRSLGTTTSTIDATTIILDFFDAHPRR